VVFNVHNSAFGDEKELREQEMALLKQYLIEAYEQGNYVIAGGDWNQNPPGFNPSGITTYKTRENWPLPAEFMPAGWTWSFDPLLPTNRDVAAPFNPDTTRCTLLDFFLTSPNIEVTKIKTMDLGFMNSDHQPVIITVNLK
jgi:endonuclease/exonuclease/phosphatase family metal-dependent hydrolase